MADQPDFSSPPPHQNQSHSSIPLEAETRTTFLPPPTSWPDASPPPPVHRPPSQSILLTPVPQPQPVPTISLPHSFLRPSKQIQSPSDAARFLSSSSGSNFLSFIASLSSAVRGCKISDPTHLSSFVSSLFSLLQSLSDAVDDIPPFHQPSRYGNPAYRIWHDRLAEIADAQIPNLLPDEFKPAAVELAPYFEDSFGNASRIDYGTGHETNFAAWLYCLTRLGLIREEDFPALVLKVFVKYLDLMRKLQTTYCLEPAGSHGVWGLDDYHFLPFIFGSSQLLDHKYMKPKSIHNEDILDNFSNEYMYLSCIAFVKKVKKGPFGEHSPLLNDISAVPSWTKVNSGLLKMYRAEVLERFPIMQHFLFGSLIKWYVILRPQSIFLPIYCQLLLPMFVALLVRQHDAVVVNLSLAHLSCLGILTLHASSELLINCCMDFGHVWIVYQNVLSDVHSHPSKMSRLEVHYLESHRPLEIGGASGGPASFVLVGPMFLTHYD
ncbi:hypothetical protein ACLOJK_013437 [Asimina triloba]